MRLKILSIFIFLIMFSFSSSAQQRIELNEKNNRFRLNNTDSDFSNDFSFYGSYGKKIKPYLNLEGEAGKEFEEFVKLRTKATICIVSGLVLTEIIGVYTILKAVELPLLDAIVTIFAGSVISAVPLVFGLALGESYYKKARRKMSRCVELTNEHNGHSSFDQRPILNLAVNQYGIGISLSF